MHALITHEKQLLEDIEQLRERFPQTQDLYREVCTLMFFRYGVTPTANKLYQLVRKGSMSAPSEALGKFWENLREKSRVRIEHPDLPDEVKANAGELAAVLWTLAQEKAVASLRGYEAEARATVIEMKSALETAKAQRDAALSKLEAAESNRQRMQEQVAALQQQMAAEAALKESLETQLLNAQADIVAHLQANESARLYFAGEIEKLRTDAQLTQERFRAAEKRALLEIDRERHAAIKLQNELDAVRTQTAREVESHRADNSALQNQLGDLRQQVGSLQGQLQVMTATRNDIASELSRHHALLAKSSERIASLEMDAGNWRNRAENAEAREAELQDQLVALRLAKKTRRKNESI